MRIVRRNYITNPVGSQPVQEYEEILRMLDAMINPPEVWTIG